MKNPNLIIIVWALIIIIAPVQNLFAQVQNNDFNNENNPSAVLSSHEPCVSELEQVAIKSRIKQSKLTLEAEGKLNPNRIVAVGSHSFIWPLVIDEHYRQFSYFNIGNFVDINSASSGLPASNPQETLQDYNCGNRTYDNVNGYDHSGIDIGIGPFPWKMMDDGVVSVVAVESGYISDKQENEWDRNCQLPSPNVYHGNYIAITHSDGSTTLYMHMKSGSVTTKAIGDNVNAGEYLGKVGSSGNSTGPHLHFEVHDDNGNILDPFQDGNCATGAHPSLWDDEEPYYNQKIVSIFTLSSDWTNSVCSTNVSPTHGYSEIVPYCNHFSPGDTIWFSAAVRDITQNMTATLKVYTPSGSLVYGPPSYVETNSYRSLTSLGHWYTFAPSTVGTYKVQCTYAGVTRAHYFTVNCPGSATLSGTRSSNYGYISGGSITSTDNISSSAVNVQYQAETFILLKPGFKALLGSQFNAIIENCSIGSTRLIETDVEKNSRWDFTVIPNPASDFVTVTVLDAINGANYEVQVFNMLGSLVFQSNIDKSNFAISMENMMDGIYLVKLISKEINGENNVSIKKLIVNH